MTLSPQLTRRRFLKTTFAFSAAATLAGCGSGIRIFDDVGNERTHLPAVGDWGKAGTHDAQTSVAAAMQNYTKHYDFQTDGLLMLGDNFYGNMPGGVNDARWQSQFEKMYPASVFNCPAFAVPGNHDYQRTPASKFETELAYAARGNTRWTMPGRYFHLDFPPDNPTTRLIFLDSNMPDEPAQPPPLDSSYYTPTDAERQEQLDWLEDLLLNQPRTTPFTIVVGHHPIYSNGPHGDNKTLIRDWDPLLRKAGVHLYIAGHDHDLQHLEFAEHPTSFVSNGAGGAELNQLRATKRGPFAAELHGFTHLQITHQLMTVRHLSEQGTLLHKFTKTPDGAIAVQG